MRIIIGGAGEVGRGVARALRIEGRDVVIVDTDSKAVKEAQALDALVLNGDITRRKDLEEAGIHDARIFIAATDSDERNLLACSLARDIVASGKDESEQDDSKRMMTIARINDDALVHEEGDGNLRRWTGVDFPVCPDEQAAERLRAGLKASSLLEVIPLDRDAWIVEVEVTGSADKLAYRTLDEAGELIDGLPKACALSRRGEKAFVPTGDETVLPGDRLVFATIGEHTFRRIAKAAGHNEPEYPENPRVAIFGATSMGIRLAGKYLAEGCSVTMIDESLEAANEVAGSELGSEKRFDVIHGDFQDHDLLNEIELSSHHIAIAAVDDDHANIAIAMLATDFGVERTGLILRDTNLARVVRRIGLTYAVSKRKVAIDSILMHVHGNVPGNYQLLTNAPNIVAMSARLKEGNRFVNKTVAEVEKSYGSCRIVFIDREGREGQSSLLRATPDKELMVNDRVFLFVKQDETSKVERSLE
jgi:trk system potassium uptake protein TrkA